MRCAMVTMSYKDDFEECRLLCESIDRYVPKEVYHYIFVRDSDLKLFKSLEGKRRIILPESSVLPWWSFNLPCRFRRHHFRISPFTIPARGWIVQQIVKLSVWKVIDARFDVFLNVDSECIFLKPFNPNVLLNGKGELGIYREEMNRESGKSLLQAHKQFCVSAKRLLGLNETIEELEMYFYIASVVAFRRDTLMEVCHEIGWHHWSRNYQMALMNTYRFSEYFLYANYVYHKSKMKGHFELKDDHFSMLKYSSFVQTERLKDEIERILSKEYVIGIWFQKKGTRHRHEQGIITFPQLKHVIHEMWDEANNTKE